MQRINYLIWKISNDLKYILSGGDYPMIMWLFIINNSIINGFTIRATGHYLMFIIRVN